MKSYALEAVVLRLRALGEADRIVTIFSRERGKQTVVARGARKTQSRFGARLDFFSRVSLMLHAAKSMDVITSVQAIAPVWERLVQPEAFAGASYVAEAIDALSEPDLAVPELYEALCEFQSALAAGVSIDALMPAIDLRMLSALGFSPELDACARCGSVLGRRPLQGGRAHLSPHAGGLLCERCTKELRAALETGGPGADIMSLNATDFAYVRSLRDRPLAQLDGTGNRRVQQLTRTFVEYQMGRRSRALSVSGASARLRPLVRRKA